MTVSANSNGRVILCVDDETTSLSVRKMLLESQGYRVLTAENGPDALVLFSSEDPELVILDYSMPGMNGDIVAERMKELRSDLPIIMLSAYVDLPSETLAIVDKSITKGEPPPILLKAISQLLNGNRKIHSKTISAK
jgi:CheY-like chemotaxis protein